jgi:tetratricopeptide (TPR) repeat protein
MSKLHSTPSRQPIIAVCVLLLLGLTIFGAAPRSLAQGTNASPDERQRAMQLYDQNKFTEAIPLLEKLVKTSPDDVIILERLGWATLVVSNSIKDSQARKAGRERARTYLLRAQALGDDSNLLRTALGNLAGPDPADLTFSNNKEADQAMREGEDAHSKGELDKAINAYQRALQLDPKLYFAALFIGDMYFKKGYQASDPRVKKEQMDKAGEWFARAIAIDENVETAYRYWGDALMHLGKQQEAKEKFVDAIIADPGSDKGYMGLAQWGQRNRIGMAHPEIEIPVKLSLSADKKLDVSFDPALRDSTDGSGAWEHYGLVRARWVAEDFAKAFPGEKVYRHTLREETEALRKAAEVASEGLKSGKTKSLSSSLTALIKLNDAGLLEPFIFFTLVDHGIARDYPTYRQANRDKLRRYWKEFVISNGK